MVRFFTWHDVEIFLEERRSSWPESWRDIQVYRDEIVIYFDVQYQSREESGLYLKKIFTRNYNEDRQEVLVDFTQNSMRVHYEESEDPERRKRSYMPLFKDMYLKADREEQKDEFNGRIIAFHSYKGGVGRTLSLISLLRECATLSPEKHMLIIDADVEAPGLTWMLEKGHAEISYLDILSLMHYEELSEDMIQDIAGLISKSMVMVPTEEVNTTHYFLPVYRDKKQVLDLSLNSEKILYVQENKFFITETIARIGAAMNIELTLVDMRAGITEFSAPYLFDDRVDKYFVTSTSMQSVKGINQIMEQVYQSTYADLVRSKVLLTMIPSTMDELQKLKIEDQILEGIEEKVDTEDDTFLRQNYIVRVGFDDALIHIDDFRSLCDSLQGKEISKLTSGLAKELLLVKEERNSFQEQEVRSVLKKLNDIATEETTAEGNSGANMLVTSSIREIAKNFHTSVPRIVVSGAKGSGKTYIYKQLLAVQTWGRFEQLVSQVGHGNEQTYVFPLLASINRQRFKKLLEDDLKFIEENFEDFQIKTSIVNDTFFQMQKHAEQELKQSEWVEIWLNAMLQPFGERFQDISELDEYLEIEQKKIVYIIDGLEDLFNNAQSTDNEGWKYAIQAICQYVINTLDDLDHGNIGMIVFARRDMLGEAIGRNYAQFQNQYHKYELNWSQTEALRLALWLTAKAEPVFAEDIDITTASKDVLAERLVKLWGLKLGGRDSREAFCDRWILAALSDFNGQLQARDIVRFLKYSTRSYADVKLIYQDRFIMPIEIRKAIEPCSEDTLGEIEAEMQSIYSILEKFKNMDPEQKQLPMTLDKIMLTGDEIARLEEQGYLKISDKKYYLPEIIRLSLKFKYEKGARPKVLSFLVK